MYGLYRDGGRAIVELHNGGQCSNFACGMKHKAHILVVDDNRAILDSLARLLGQHFGRVTTLHRPDELPSALGTHRPDAVLLDMNFRTGVTDGNEGLYWLDTIRRQAPSTPVVLMTAYADVAIAVEGMRRGAADFVEKPWDNSALVRALCRVTSPASSAGAPHPSGPAMMWGTHPAMAELRALVERVAVTDANLLITGENGTGKEMLAAEIHRLSGRASGPLVSIDMGAVSESLFESELFGHARGAFTGADAARPGRMESADGGTLFMDEIANLPLHMQPKLLAALQSRSVTRLGENKPRPVNLRLICATNADIDAMVCAGTFRQDLYYRINTITLHLPALRERAADIVPLARRFADEFAEQYGRPPLSITPAACAMLEAYGWPGNVRQLRHAVERAVILSAGSELTPAVFSLPDARPAAAEAEGTIEQMERNMIRSAIDRSGGNLSAAATALGITRQTLYNKIRRYGLAVNPQEDR